MRRFVPLVPRRWISVSRLALGFALALGLAFTTIQAQIPGRNVNMVSGSSWPDGDPFLQRQNEPSIAASTRNPLHLLAGANDYRTVDLPGLPGDETGDAWLGLFKSFDGGQRWVSTLLPGYRQDTSDQGLASPIRGYGAGADPVVRAGTNGLIYYAGLVFDRSNPMTPDVPGKSAIFVSRFIDNNNVEAGDTFAYLGTRTLQTDPGGATGNFLDKPWMVVDIPRDATRCTIVTTGEKGKTITQNLPAGPVYVAYTLRSTDEQGPRYDVYFTRSVDCGNTWTMPVRLNSASERANQGATMAVDPRNGNVFIAWRQFDLTGDNDAVMSVKYTAAGKKLDPPGFAHKFPKSKGKGKGLNPEHFYKKGGVNKAIEAAQLSPLDQATSDIAGLLAFRTNAYPSLTVDGTGRVYMAWAERGYEPNASDPIVGDARIMIATSADGKTWTNPKAVAVEGQLGHQLMPSITFAGGKLMLVYYDLRETRSEVFSKWIDDVTALAGPRQRRHTIDLRASMGTPGDVPVFAPSVRVSDYLMGAGTDGTRRQLQVNPPNLPMFKQGTAPFMGDYVDVTAAPNFIVDAAGNWTYNSVATSTPPVFHATWTDNRDVRPPLHDRNGDGNPWNDYTPPGALGGITSILDPTQLVGQCIPGNAGSRNQNIYTARITGGILVGSPGNTKTLSPDFQRAFVVFVQNTTAAVADQTATRTKTFRLTITNQPANGRASFNQFPLPANVTATTPPLTVIDTVVPALSTASRTVYVTSTDPHARLSISVAEISAVGGSTVTGGLGGVVVLNPDIDNPDIDNPDIDNPDIDNPDIDNAEVYNLDIGNPDIDNPDIDNPDIDNPDIDNPDIDNVVIANPDIDNPDIDNPDIDNPDIDNPDIDNPDIDNPDIDNASLTDVSWTITNTGNTTAAYNVNLFFAQTTIKPELSTQLILYRTYRTPVVVNCVLKYETRNVLVANIPNPELVKSSTGSVSDPNDPEATNATIWLAPGESAKITLRVLDQDDSDSVTVTNPDGTEAKIDPSLVPNEDVTLVVQQQGVNTEAAAAGETEPPIVVQFPAPQTVPDAASTAPSTPVTFNVLANDSTAFGSTKVISLHPPNMAAHSGGFPGDIAYQSSTGFLYTQRGIVDPATNALVGRLALPPGGLGLVYQQANQRTGINYGRTSLTLTALDARPGSVTFHQYLPMPAVSNIPLSFALDTTNHRMYVVHGTTTGALTAAVSAIDIQPGSGTFHQVLFTSPLPGVVRGQAIAVNSRTRKVYVSGSSTNGGVFVLDGTLPAPPAVKVPNTLGAWSIAVNEASNLVFAAISQGSNFFGLHVIDGATNALTQINTTIPMRFNTVDERLVVHIATGKIFMRLENVVVVIDGQRGSPTRNTVLGVIGVGRDNNTADIAVDQELGLVVTVGAYDFRVDIIDVNSNGLVATIPLLNGPTDVAIDPVNHRAFLSVPLTYVQELSLSPVTPFAAPTASVPVFVESGGAVVNPVTNKVYAGILAIGGSIGKISGSGFEGVVPGLSTGARYVFSARHVNTNRYFILNMANDSGTSIDPGSMVVLDGATDALLGVLDTPPNPFGIGIDQTSDKVYVASLSTSSARGGITIYDAVNPDTVAPVQTTLAAAFPLNAPGAFVSFGRHVVVNPATRKVYVMLTGGSPTSLAVLDPVTNVITPLDGGAALPLGNTWGRVEVIRVDASLNRIFVGMYDSVSNTNRIVAIDGTSDQVVGSWVGGRHSNRHTASYLIVNEAMDRLYVTNYDTDTLTVLDAATMLPVGDAIALPDGPSAMAFNGTANRLYVSSINSKMITAVNGDTLAIESTVRLPLVAYFLFVDEIESRIYTSGGDSADESGVMVITDVLGQLGTNVSVSSIIQPSNGVAVLNADYSITYTSNPGFAGADQFGYTVTAPTGSANGVVNVTVVQANPRSVAFADGYSTAMNQPLSIAAPGPLANDATGDPLATMDVTNTTDNGTLVPQSNGSFLYTPNAGYVGLDVFEYRTQGVMGASNTIPVAIVVTAPSDLVVTTTADSGAGSLRQAMSIANIEPGSVIRFNIAGPGPHTIQPNSALPTMNVPVTIDGFTQPDAVPNTAVIGTNAVLKIVVRGASAGSTNGFNLRGGNSTIRGLVINGFSQSGILLDSTAGGNTVEGNFIGTDVIGTLARPNGTGVSSQSPGNLIGGTTLAARNLISGNTFQGARALASSSNGVISSMGSGTMFKGNLIGTSASGMTALPNGGGGITLSAPNVVIGGTTAAERNVISGNNGTGINAFAGTFSATPATPAVVMSVPEGLIVQGNYIGTTADGLAALGNSSGVSSSGANTTIGGSTDTSPGGACTGACNLISGNSGTGVSLTQSSDNATATLTSVASDSVVEGNYIGVNVNGTGAGALGNLFQGLHVSAPRVMVGGGTAATRNVISGNGTTTSSSGINLSSGTASTSTPSTPSAALSTPATPGNVDNGDHRYLWTFVTVDGETTAGGQSGTVTVVNKTVNGQVTVSVPIGGFGVTARKGYRTAAGFSTFRLWTTINDNTTTVTTDNTTDAALGAVTSTFTTTLPTLLTSATGAVIRGNFIGLNAAGTAAVPNHNGITVAAPNVRIGGTTASDRNVISGNAQSGINSFASTFNRAGFPSIVLTTPSGLIVQGNYVGTRADGVTAQGNGSTGISVSGINSLVGGSTDTTPGGACTGACNVVAANQTGISIYHAYDGTTGQLYSSGTGTIVEGNYVGLDATGLNALANSSTGINVAAANVLIGNGTPAGRNLVAANGGGGINLASDRVTATNAVVGTANGTRVRGNWVGFDAAGTLRSNGQSGISSGAAGVFIGGPLVSDGNAIASSNATTNPLVSLYRHTNGAALINAGGTTLVQNNIIGTNIAGTTRLNGAGSGVWVSTAGNQVLNNVIAGLGSGANTPTGVSISGSFATGNAVRGNYIGTNATGTLGLGNTGNGVGIYEASNNTIGGSAAADRNVIVGSGFGGINIGANAAGASANGNTVLGNYIGVLPDGVSAHANNGGVSLFSQAGTNITGTMIGAPGAGNVIAGNFYTGISLSGAGTSNTVIAANSIGVDKNGDARGNTGAGVYVNDSSNNRIGGAAADANTIANNSVGVAIQSAATGNQVLSNVIRANTSLGIDLGWNGVTANDNGDTDNGPNGLQNFPLLLNAASTPQLTTAVETDLSSFSAGQYTLQFFASAMCDGNGNSRAERLVGTFDSVSPSGVTTFQLTPAVAAGEYLTATATDALGNTSEFSGCTIQADVVPTAVTNTSNSGSGSLRSAITYANVAPGTQTITFNIPGVGPHTIQPTSMLPVISAPTVIDGYSQPGASPNTLATGGTSAVMKIVLNGANAVNAWAGLSVGGGGTTIRGLVINGFTAPGAAGLLLDSPSGGDAVAGNFLGTDATGMVAVPNARGVILHSPTSVIGGSAAADRNLISGNTQSGAQVSASTNGATVYYVASGSSVRNNLIGTNATGMAALPNLQDGIQVSVPSVTIGGTNPAHRNVISGNGQMGINTYASTFGATVLTVPSALRIEGNYVGTRADGMTALANGNGGINVSGPGSIIGGTLGTNPGGACTGACNLISGNNSSGLQVSNHFDYNGAGTIYSAASGSVVAGNYIGVDVLGTAALPNTANGVDVGAPNVTVGGNTPAARNLVSGNGSFGITVFVNYTAANVPLAVSGSGALIRGNFIGVNRAGTAPLTNGQGGVGSWVPNVTIGGPAATDRNVIVSSTGTGVNLSRQTNGAIVYSTGGNSVVQGNYIGVDEGGTVRMNGATGVFVSTSNNQILGNVIAGNGVGGPVPIYADGVRIHGPSAPASGNIVKGNYIGTNAAGDAGLGNTGSGVSIADASNNTIGGIAPGDRNVIAGNGNIGVNIDTSGLSPGIANGNVVLGNYIGVKPDGATALANANGGVNFFANNGGTISGNTIGGSAPGSRNIISGNVNNGVNLNSTGAINNAVLTNNVVAGNYIGTTASGLAPLPNAAAGIFVNQASGNTIGGPNASEGNLVAFNNGPGVAVFGVRNRILSNRIHSNVALGIDLGWNGVTANDNGDGDSGANDQQNFPVMSSIDNSGATTTVFADLSHTVVGNYTVQVFANAQCDATNNGEGQRLVGSATIVQPGGTVTLTELVPGIEFLSATATDSNGNTSEFSACLPVSAPSTLVTNTNDTGAGSLRDAITNSNAMPGTQTISFNIPGASAASPAIITVAPGSPLPIIMAPVVIDGSTQGGWDGRPVIEISGGNAIANGFETTIDISGVQIKDLSITRFTNAGIMLMQAETLGGHTISGNYLGTDRFGNVGKGNYTGVVVRSDSSNINTNVISGNTVGVRLENDADSVVISTNKIGMMQDGLTARPNSEAGIRMFDSLNNNIILNNMISKNGGWGIEVQDSLAGDVTGTMIYGNTIGLDANGNIAGNFGGGVRLQNAPATNLGQPGAAVNVISGNGGPNPPEIGVGVQVIGPGAVNIRNNYIGLDPTGVFARSNNNKGIVLDGVAQVGGNNANERNYISGNGDAAGGAGIIINPTVPNGTVIAGNVIGLNVNDQAVPNGYAGITVRSISLVTIGGAANAANVISGNGSYGISVIRVVNSDPYPSGTVIQNNIIGADSTGAVARANGTGGIYAGGNNLQIGAWNGGNQIKFNGGVGIGVPAGMTGVRMETNMIDANGGLGIDLAMDGPTANDPGDTDAGANDLQNFLTVMSATNTGASNTFATVDTSEIVAGTYLVEFFKSQTCDASGYGEGAQSLIRFGITAQTGVIQLNLNSQVPAGWFVTTLVTSDATGNTSEFSNCAVVAAVP